MIPNRYVLGLSREVLYDLLGLAVSKLETLKVCGQKKLRHFGFEATPFATFVSELLLFGRPGFESRLAQTLRA